MGTKGSRYAALIHFYFVFYKAVAATRHIAAWSQKRVKTRQKSGPGVWPAGRMGHIAGWDKKAGKGTTEKRAGRMACGQKLFSVLIFFGPFLYQDKKGLASAAIERRV